MTRSGAEFGGVDEYEITFIDPSAADGMRTVARFAYARSAPVPGFDQRVTVLDKLTLESSGYNPLSYTYSYGSPVAHSVNHQLTGLYLRLAHGATTTSPAWWPRPPPSTADPCWCASPRPRDRKP